MSLPSPYWPRWAGRHRGNGQAAPHVRRSRLAAFPGADWRERRTRSALRLGQTQRIGDEAWPQRQLWVERAPRDLRSRNDRLTHEAQSERGEKHGPRPRCPGGQEAQTCPCRGGNGSQPHRKITQVTAGNHEPEAKEYRGSRNRNSHEARRGFISRGSQGANPKSVMDVILDRSWRPQLNETPERFSFCRAVRLGIAPLNQFPSTSANLPCAPGSANVERHSTCGMAPHCGGPLCAGSPGALSPTNSLSV